MSDPGEDVRGRFPALAQNGKEEVALPRLSATDVASAMHSCPARRCL
jgi:hypothetical protein